MSTMAEKVRAFLSDLDGRVAQYQVENPRVKDATEALKELLLLEDESGEANGLDLHQKVLEHQRRTGTKSYSESLFAVSRSYVKGVNEAEKHHRKPGTAAQTAAADRQAAGIELDKRAREIVKATGSDYESAFRTAMTEQPHQAEIYLAGSPHRRSPAAAFPDQANLDRVRHQKPLGTEGSGVK